MEKTIINNEKKFIERVDKFIDISDKLNYRSYFLKNSSIIKRYNNNKRLFSTLMQLKDMIYKRLDDKTISKLNRLEQLVLNYDKDKVNNYKGLRSIDERYFTYTKTIYRILNREIIKLTTTWGGNNGSRQPVY